MWTSENFSERRGGHTPRLILIHYTAMDSYEAAAERLCSQEHEVSAHYLIAEDGRVAGLVPEEKRAWHAGAGYWGGCCDINSASIGIELANPSAQPFSEPQMAALERLLPQVMARWGIGAAGVIGHSDIAPSRKFDPGARFDWRRLALQGLAIWPQGAAEGDFEASLTALGYSPLEPLEARLRAYRLRFAPWRHGALTHEDAAEAAWLATRFAVDPALAKP